MKTIQQKIHQLDFEVRDSEMTKNLVKDYEENGLDSMRIKFYKEFEKNGFSFSNQEFWKLKNIIDEG